MKKTTRTFLYFDERQLEQISKLKSVLGQYENKDISNKEMMLIAMSVGYVSKNRLKDYKKSNTGPRLQYLQTEDNAFFAALQIAETSDPKSLLDIEDLYDLAEQYAAGGVSILYKKYMEENDFLQWFEAFVYEHLKRQDN
jgi:hypothetical protein